jgi:putative chitinase
MQITRQQLLRAVPDLFLERVDEFVASFNQWAIPYGIDNKKKVVHYLAQVFHESGALRYTTEIASGAAYDTGPKAIALGNTP